MSKSYELKWRDCSGNYGPWRTQNGHFTYRLTDDLITAHVGVKRFEEGIVEAFLEDKQDHKFALKNFKYKNENDVEEKVEEAKNWAENEMRFILEKNLKALEK